MPLWRLSKHRGGDRASYGQDGRQAVINFQYARADDVADAVRRIAADPTAKFIAGGTNLIDLMKGDVEHPSRLIDISRLPLKSVEETSDGGLRIGALVPISDGCPKTHRTSIPICNRTRSSSRSSFRRRALQRTILI